MVQWPVPVADRVRSLGPCNTYRFLFASSSRVGTDLITLKPVSNALIPDVRPDGGVDTLW